jgi:Flp pilus assembly protein TadD
MKQKRKWIPMVVGVVLGALWSSRGLAQSSALQLSELRFAGAGSQRTLTLQFSQTPSAVQSFVLTSPTRLVIDVSGPVPNVSPGTIPVKDTLLARVRTGIHDHRLRFVLDLQTTEIPKFSVAQQQGIVTALLTVPGEQLSEPFSYVLFTLPGRAAPSTSASVLPKTEDTLKTEDKPKTKEKQAPISEQVTSGEQPPAPTESARVAKKLEPGKLEPGKLEPSKPEPGEPESGERKPVVAEEVQAPTRDSKTASSQISQEHLERGRILYAKGEVDAAIGQWQETLRVAPETAKAHHLLGLALQRRGKIPEAIAALQEVVRLKPDDAVAYIHLGQILETKGDIEAARAAYQKAQQLVPTSAYVYDRLGHLSAAQEKWGETVYAWRETVRLRPQSAAAYANLGEALEKAGKQEEALAAYERALKLDPQRTLATNVRSRVTQLRTSMP